MKSFVRLLVLVLSSLNGAESLVASRQQYRVRQSATATRHSLGSTLEAFASTTIEAPTRERTDTDTRRKSGRTADDDDDVDDDVEYPDLEYLQDPSASRDIDDPFHILLLGSTFEKPKVTVSYVSGSLEYVLNMPSLEATELSKFAKDEGMSCLGTWPREECLTLGRQLQVRDLVCRVVPYCEGGQRGWQARDANHRDRQHSSGGGGGNQDFRGRGPFS